MKKKVEITEKIILQTKINRNINVKLFVNEREKAWNNQRTRCKHKNVAIQNKFL